MHSQINLPLELNLRSRLAFTLVEVLVSMTVLLVLLLISAQVIGTVQSTWSASNARIGQFREARTAFDIITRNLSQATLNTYIDYEHIYLKDGQSTGVASNKEQKYIRKSDLRFVCGPTAGLLPQSGGPANSPGQAVFFQAPLGVAHDPAYVGLDRLLCGRGYFVQYVSDAFFRPTILPAGLPRYRYRLMEFSPPAEQNMIYSDDKNAWFEKAGVQEVEEENPVDRGLTRPVADNIIALIISPQIESDPITQREPTSIAPDFEYDSIDVGSAAGLVTGGGIAAQGTQHLLPPLVRVVLVAIDEKSADRISQSDSSGTPPFGEKISDMINNSDAENLNKTLEGVAEELRLRRINYRIFSTTVVLRGAKWSI